MSYDGGLRLAWPEEFALVRGQERGLVASGATVVADLDRVSFIDAAGLGMVARAARQAQAHRSSMHVVCDQHRTRRLFRLTAVDSAVVLSATRAEALEAITAGQEVSGGCAPR